MALGAQTTGTNRNSLAFLGGKQDYSSQWARNLV